MGTRLTFEDLMKTGFASSEIFQDVFKEIQKGFLSHPDPFHHGELPPRHLMTWEDHEKVRLTEEQFRDEDISLENGVFKSSTKIGIEMKFGGGQETEYSFTDWLAFLNNFSQERVQKIPARLRPKPIVLTDQDVKLIEQGLRARTDRKIKELVREARLDIKLFEMLEDFKKRMPFWPVICSQYATYFLQPETWQDFDLIQAYRMINGMLKLVDNVLLDKKRINVEKRLKLWLEGSALKYINILARYDALKKSKAYKTIKKINYQAINSRSLGDTKQVEDIEAFKKRLYRRLVRQKKPDICIPKNVYAKYGNGEGCIPIDNENPYGRIVGLPDSPSMFLMRPSSSRPHNLIIYWRTFENKLCRVIAKDFLDPKKKSAPLHFINSQGDHSMTLNGFNHYGPVQGVDPVAFTQANIERNGVITRYPNDNTPTYDGRYARWGKPSPKYKKRVNTRRSRKGLYDDIIAAYERGEF